MDLSSILRGLWVSMTSRKKVIGGVAVGDHAESLVGTVA